MIYAIGEGERPEMVKIGFCKGAPFEGSAWLHQLRHRLRDAQMGNPRELVVVALCDGTIKDERAMHAALHRQRVLNEWFRCEGETLAFVEGHRIDPIGRGSIPKVYPKILRPDTTHPDIARIIESAWNRIKMDAIRPVGPRRVKAGMGDEWRQSTCDRCGRVGHRAQGCMWGRRPGRVQVPVSNG